MRIDQLPVKTYDGKPGRYVCGCYRCGKQFLGDKRDVGPCPDCDTKEEKA